MVNLLIKKQKYLTAAGLNKAKLESAQKVVKVVRMKFNIKESLVKLKITKSRTVVMIELDS